MSAEAFQFVVRGRVQGVGYRYFALRAAESLQVGGFVRNLPDGSVEVMAEGRPEALERLREQLGAGPSFSLVENVEATPVAPRGVEGFHIR